MKKIITLFSIGLLLFSCDTHKPSFKGTPFEKHTTLNGTGFTQSRLDSLINF